MALPFVWRDIRLPDRQKGVRDPRRHGAALPDRGGVVTEDDAREFSENLAQIGQGWYRQIAWAFRMEIPAMLGLGRREWAEQFHGYLKLPIPERREAVAELAAEGMSHREIADALGIGKATVTRDLDPGPDGPPDLAADLADQPIPSVPGPDGPPDLTDYEAAIAEFPVLATWPDDPAEIVAAAENLRQLPLDRRAEAIKAAATWPSVAGREPPPFGIAEDLADELMAVHRVWKKHGPERFRASIKLIEPNRQAHLLETTRSTLRWMLDVVTLEGEG